MKNTRNFISNVLSGIAIGVITILIAFLFIKGNEISDLFYSFLETVVGFVPYVVGAIILYCLGWFKGSKETEKFKAESEELLAENKEMKNLLRQALSYHENDRATIESLRAKDTMSQIADLPGGATEKHTSDLQSPTEED